MKILITGIAGFLGQHLARQLMQGGHEVIGFDLSEPMKAQGAEVICGNLVSQAGFNQVPWDELDAIYHLASAGVKPSSRKWSQCVDVNISGTLNLISNIRRKCVQNPTFIYTHSFYEDLIIENPVLKENPYILTKSAATKIVEFFASVYEGAVIDFRLFQVYGPGDGPETVLPYVCTRLSSRKTAELGSGIGLRDWVYVDDVISGLLLALDRPAASGISQYDLGSGVLTSIRNVVEMVSRSFGVGDDLLVFDEARDRADVGLAEVAHRSLPGWICQTSLASGIKRLVESYMNVEK